MTAKLKSLLVATGLVVVVGLTALPVYVRDSDATDAALADAGLPACPERLATCSVRALVNGEPVYQTVKLTVRECPDGVVLPVTDADLAAYGVELLDMSASCTFKGDCKDSAVCNKGGKAIAAAAHECACRKASGSCTVAGQPAPFGATLAAGTWTGAGCQPKPCGPERNGEQGKSWPANCPERAP
jgi:hypothetical protein